MYPYELEEKQKGVDASRTKQEPFCKRKREREGLREGGREREKDVYGNGERAVHLR